MSTIPYHHLYSIHILVIISRRVVDAFGLCFLSLSCLMFAFSRPHYFTILLSVSFLELGRRLRCREQTAQVSRVFFFPLSPRIYFVPYLYDFVFYSMLHTLPPPILLVF